MPIYEYSCKTCKKNFEISQKITEKQKTKCPACKGKLEKVISLSAFHLKGTGWFKTMTKSKKEPPSSSSSSSSSCGEGACDSKKAQTECRAS